jgi:protein-S-isoprenylcysteine O-methyltransferase Ste14
MNSLNLRAFGGLLNLTICLWLSIFIPAWTLKYWQGWVFLAVFMGSSLAITLYLMKADPELLKRRVKAGATAEKEAAQKIIQGIAGLAFIATIVLPAFDHRFGWSKVPLAMSVAGDGSVVAGFFIVFRVFKENSFTSGTIEVGEGQSVVSTGPYAVIRHPMYSGALVLLAGAPIALGSWWGLLMILPMLVVLICRLKDEEKFLVKNLPGYTEYRNRVRFRLVPTIW